MTWTDTTAALREEADLAYRAGYLAPAIRLYRRLLRRHPADAVQVPYLIAVLYKQTGQPKRAWAWFMRVMAAPDAPVAVVAGGHMHLGKMCLDERDAAGAAEQARRGVDPRPGLDSVVRFIEALPGDPASTRRVAAVATLQGASSEVSRRR
jgi:lipopolysaccharide biosynthesis regulator YciM